MSSIKYLLTSWDLGFYKPYHQQQNIFSIVQICIRTCKFAILKLFVIPWAIILII